MTKDVSNNKRSPCLPAISPEIFIKNKRPRRATKARKFQDHIAENIVERHCINNTRAFLVPDSRTEQYRNSFFVATVVDWNHLEDNTVSAPTPEAFRSRLLGKHSPH